MFKNNSFRGWLFFALMGASSIFIVSELYIYFFDPIGKSEYEAQRRLSLGCVIDRVSSDLDFYYMDNNKYPEIEEIKKMIITQKIFFNSTCNVSFEQLGGELIAGGMTLNVDSDVSRNRIVVITRSDSAIVRIL